LARNDQATLIYSDEEIEPGLRPGRNEELLNNGSK
jgi:hypothetical protein